MTTKSAVEVLVKDLTTISDKANNLLVDELQQGIKLAIQEQVKRVINYMNMRVGVHVPLEVFPSHTDIKPEPALAKIEVSKKTK